MFANSCPTKFPNEEHYLPTDIGTRNLTGKGQGGKGIVDLTCFRYRFARYMTTVFAERHKFHEETKVALRRMCSSHQDRGLACS
jgi:hypothetical protein